MLDNNIMLSIDEAISKAFYDPGGYGSINETLKDAKTYNPDVKYDDVKKWKEKNLPLKKNLRGFNSYIASAPYDEFQIDLMFFSDLDDQKYRNALLMVDIFSKFVSVIPMNSKNEGDVLAALIEGFNEMKGTPKMIYSDEETSFMSKYTQDLFKEKKITHITTRGHAPYAERAIRTIKNMIYQRLDHLTEIKQWVDVLNYVLITYNYKLKSSVTGFTPNEARKEKNLLEVKSNLEMHRINKRKYPDINVGDKVKIYTKKASFKAMKERYSVWSDSSYEVEKIEDKLGQKFYYTTARERPFSRHELLLVS